MTALVYLFLVSITCDIQLPYMIGNVYLNAYLPILILSNLNNFQFAIVACVS